MHAEFIKNKDIGRRYKKWLFIAALSGLVVVSLGFAAFGFVAYKAVNYTYQQARNSSFGEFSTNLTLGKPGFVEEFVIDVANGWLKQSLTSIEMVSFKNGLACIDAVGGPSPLAVVGYLKERVSDVGVLKRLDDIMRSLQTTDLPPIGAGACTNWILSS